MTDENKNGPATKDETERELVDALRELLSPEAVGAIVAWLQPATTKNAQVNIEIEWFRDTLLEMLGVDEFNRICEEVGL